MNKNERRVLEYLYAHKDDPRGPSTEAIVSGTGLSKATVTRALTSLSEQGLISGPDSLAKLAADGLREIDPKFLPTSPGYSEHLVVLASVLAKADEAFLADELGFDAEFVHMVGARLRAAGIWQGDHIQHQYRERILADCFGFFMTGAIACGDLKIVGGTPDNPQFQMTDAGGKRAARLIRDMG